MWKPAAVLVFVCALSGCSEWMARIGGGGSECTVSHDAGTFTLLVRDGGAERALARTAPLSKEELQELSGYTCGPEGRDTPCDHAAYVKDAKTGRWAAYAYGAKDPDGALLEDLFRDLPVVTGSRIIGSEPNPCRLGAVPAEQASAFREATFAMRLADRAFQVPAAGLAVALEEGAALEWFRPGSLQRSTQASERQGTSTRFGLVDAAKLLAWALGVFGGVAAIWGRLAHGRTAPRPE